jgi:hypothetical protein
LLTKPIRLEESPETASLAAFRTTKGEAHAFDQGVEKPALWALVATAPTMPAGALAMLAHMHKHELIELLDGDHSRELLYALGGAAAST